MDSVGVGALPDAEKFGDRGANTFEHVAEAVDDLKIPHLQAMGWGNIDGLADGRFAVAAPSGAFGKMGEVSMGKDTITGHWEIAGLETKEPFRTYPDGFPLAFMEKFEEAIGTGCLGNYPASGTEIIEELGPAHEETGKPIVYTSADSVFQIAANIDIIPLERLYEICEIARGLLVGQWACGRVIARPYRIVDGQRKRTADRKDYAVSPSGVTMLDRVQAAGKKVYAVGKISDIFNNQGVDESVHTDSNMDGVDKTIQAMGRQFEGLIFVNLVDFDSQYGHRRDAAGYAEAIMEFDARLPEIMAQMGDEELLILCADHGNDPVHAGYDHTREYVPLVVWGKNVKPGVNLGIRNSFADIDATVCEYLGAEPSALGTSFLQEIL